ncbi:hypothetical protein [Paenibacillus sp. GCM10012306]|uniref:hypothetical protein n=1 Tax=Paenibacillus sp. GCM10012306 TaxID=3317342 RepID=UPI0036D21A26
MKKLVDSSFAVIFLMKELNPNTYFFLNYNGSEWVKSRMLERGEGESLFVSMNFTERSESDIMQTFHKFEKLPYKIELIRQFCAERNKN